MKWILLLVLIGMILAVSCSKDEAATGSDLELLNLAKASGIWVYYKLDSSYLNRSSGSGHNFKKLRTRFNAIAATQLDIDGKVKSNAQFADGSVVVKELTDDTHHVERFAILYKNSTHADADSRGWVWGYVNADGTVSESATKKGNSCIGCHTQVGSLDYILMNKFFP
ncbi:MAG: cytochrome P460 family protein [Saprospiraceae bacterium]|nr:cytochrome P460 family protein [Saprospiraceae bacterium]